MKADRGRAVHSDHMLGVDYWVERNFNQEEDTSIQALAAPRKKQFDSFMADPELADLHAKAIAWRKSHFEKLMLKEPFRALFGRLLMTAPTRLVPKNAARFMVGFANAARKKNGN